VEREVLALLDSTAMSLASALLEPTTISLTKPALVARVALALLAISAMSLASVSLTAKSCHQPQLVLANFPKANALKVINAMSGALA
jgi:hypothetical protein